MMHLASIDEIPPFTSEKRVEVNAIVETPQGSRNKYKYDIKSGMFRLGSVLPIGATFPFQFGFIPRMGDDGDPLDLLLLLDSPTFAGCAVTARVIGVIEALQHGPGEKSERNDRLIAVPTESRRHAKVRELHDLGAPL
jgi:inorganic pyrophosphatase